MDVAAGGVAAALVRPVSRPRFFLCHLSFEVQSNGQSTGTTTTISLSLRGRLLTVKQHMNRSTDCNGRGRNSFFFYGRSLISQMS